MIIYSIRNLVNQREYIGQTIRTPSWRWNRHRCDLNNGKHPNIRLQNAWLKYGPTAFDFVIIHITTTRQELDSLESKCIGELGDRAYNLKSGGRSGYVVSDETRKRMKESKTPEWRAAASQRMKARNPMLNTESKRKAKEGARRGNDAQKSLECRERMRITLQRVRPSAKLTKEDVQEIRKERKQGMTYRDLAKKFAVGSSAIGRIVRGECWSFVENEK